jgi:hypothetical protein
MDLTDGSPYQTRIFVGKLLDFGSGRHIVVAVEGMFL